MDQNESAIAHIKRFIAGGREPPVPVIIDLKPSVDTSAITGPTSGALSWRLEGTGPFRARSASDTKEDWPFWYVAGPDGKRNILTDGQGHKFTSREEAERIAAAANGDVG